ncbi:MAG: VRR-NUC domain-containing protein [Gammaproteobacteria bacterium]|nr:MAG: VRR-NUC domain-containing protein [Gammaproteobacteria bacterium]
MTQVPVAIPPDYYLTNFKFLVKWVVARYADLLDKSEQDFVEKFERLGHSSQCLFVRLSSRKGNLFRTDKWKYTEISSLEAAAEGLIRSGFISTNSLLSISDAVNLLTKAEALTLFKNELKTYKNERKEVLVELLAQQYPSTNTWRFWTQHKFGDVYRIETGNIIANFMLLFFGNAHQNLTEFVLQDLGLYRYENYEIHQHNRIFKSRAELEEYQQLLLLREQLAMVTTLDELIAITEALGSNPASKAMETRYARFYNQLAYEFERFGQDNIAFGLYQKSHLPPARERRIRVLEKQGEYAAAWQLLTELIDKPYNEHELQVGERMIARLSKKVGNSILKKKPSSILTTHLELPRLCDETGSYLNVEEISRLYFNVESAPCFYVENQLLIGLFGLWLWPEIFRNVDGAFANPFQSAPLDMYDASFIRLRPQISELWNLFDDNSHQEHIRNYWKEKYGLENHFVNWRYLDQTALEYALDCIPAQHLKFIFKRLLFDVKSNRSGLPDLIQFFPEQRHYRMLEIKGPGDRIQDNQQRWLEYFLKHGIPAEVIYVKWQ